MDFFILITWLPENILILLWEIRCWSILETQGSKKWCPVISDQYCRFFTGKHLFIPTCLIDKESCSLIEQSKTYTGQANLRASCPKRGQEFNFLLAPRHQFTMYWKPLPFILLHCFTLSKTFLFLGFFFLIILIYKTNSPIERIFSAWSD